ncbi:hypothetical protein PDIP_89490 [Penicillium digitatum Pd1]|uniref:Uncharacterized protein n=1 Tax=Penicillium digitatum (strain Pd1 / CECT 20795) TaxID=1170230 RepID=K9FMN4_PEND1|nr:hypothetical protein PDIP_89490 [Penicillium digitatum Pd1]EKV04043.1 hypothetical protein PDIP_89490 [Penicillium digitatum Pd1]
MSIRHRHSVCANGASNPHEKEHQSMQVSVFPVDNWQVVDVTSSFVCRYLTLNINRFS